MASPSPSARARLVSLAGRRRRRKRGAPQPSAAAPPYPPARTGLRGNDPAAVEAFPTLQAGTYRVFPALDVDTRESYDVEIVGGDNR